MKAESFVQIVEVFLCSSILVRHLFLEQKPISQENEDCQWQKEKVIYSLTEKVDPHYLV